MSHVKSGGSVNQSGLTPGQRLGLKVTQGQTVNAGAIIVRQKGTNFLDGAGTKMAKDHSIIAKVAGVVHFKKIVRPRGTRVEVSVIPSAKE